ncbi:beta-galactosidase [Paenibacillus sp. BIHB 4019]|uniref:Beta-galactosidase n=1 Tax=Paenibacillus sp. BIHB 4019 TaxID=1870819 RepID=A0A1B2DF16_9BACL|nr:glycoside hydrolase family 35 protein [Paenibacillus sp. BIHB 4019]ANY66285.1 beta-galactosidase [Paenibacillus sp. BIHB 4019]
MAIFECRQSQFFYDEKPIQLLSGALHYFRIVPEYWSDRLQKLKACGFNTVETYVPWNFHEPKPGKFRFDGMADLERFIQTAGEMGLLVIVRASPFICAEWEFGGLPAWLLADDEVKLRCYNEKFLERVDAYYDVLLPKLQPLLCTNGGPIIALQIENEYGSYGNDASYLEYLRQAMVRRGMNVLLFTSDGPTDSMLQGGSVPGQLSSVNFGSGVKGAFSKLREYQADQPVMCMEYWIGWFDHWGEQHHTRDAGDVASVFEEMLEEKGSVNFYMFHGGTNFGFYNGANCQQKDQYEPTITSYDYDSLLSESGDLTDKFYTVRAVIDRYMKLGELKLPEPIGRRAYGQVAMAEQAALFSQIDRLSAPIRRTNPEPMEKLGQDYGFILYQTTISGPREKQELVVQEVRDRALVFVDGKLAGVLERGNQEQTVSFEVPAEGAEIAILVENMGRINYGPYLRDPKGITEGVRFGFQFLYDWTIHCLPLDDLSPLQFAAEITDAFASTNSSSSDNASTSTNTSNSTAAAQASPAFYRGTFQADDLQDTFLRLEGWTKGVAFINGFNLGRYWDKGPQQTLYVPAPLLRQGENAIVLFELHGTANRSVTFVDTPDLGG